MPIKYACPHCGHNTTVAEVHAGHSGPCAACGKTISVPTVEVARRERALTGGVRPSLGGMLAMVGGVGFIGLLLIGLLMALLIPLRDSRNTQTRTRESQNKLQQIVLAMHTYHDTYGTFPPAYLTDADGKPMHSWRVLLLPYLEERTLYESYDFDEPWDGPKNALLQRRVLDVYRSPSDKEGTESVSYMVVVGEKTMFPPDGEAISMSHVRDGLSNTILVVEVYDSGVEWMEPKDLDFDSMAMVINDRVDPGIASGEKNTAAVGMADGASLEIASDTPPELIRAALTRSGNERAPMLQ